METRGLRVSDWTLEEIRLSEMNSEVCCMAREFYVSPRLFCRPKVSLRKKYDDAVRQKD